MIKIIGLSVILLILISFHSIQSHAAYFYLADNEPTCFVEDVPEDTAILVKYANLDFEQLSYVEAPEGQVQVAHIDVYDPNNRVILDHDCSKKGQLAFTSLISGDYRICIEIGNSLNQHRTYKFGLKVQSATESREGGANFAKQEHFGAIYVELSKINDRVSSLRQEHLHFKKIETISRDEEESLNEYILYLFALQTTIIVCAMVYQIFKLRSFFRTKQFVN